jgi:hypothetical protein
MSLTNNKRYNSKRNNTDCTYEWALAHGTPVFTLHYLSTGNDHAHNRKYIYIRNWEIQDSIRSAQCMICLTCWYTLTSLLNRAYKYIQNTWLKISMQSANPLDSRKYCWNKLMLNASTYPLVVHVLDALGGLLCIFLFWIYHVRWSEDVEHLIYCSRL